MKTLMIYGATGYTGRMVAAEAHRAGLEPVLAGRDAGNLASLSLQLGVAHRVFALNDVTAVERGLTGVDLLINCAGPFQKTAPILIPAAIRSGTHYVDVSAELESYRISETLSATAVSAGVMLMPGGGGSVAMLGSLVAAVAETIENPIDIAVALHVSGSMSRGSAISASENLTPLYMVRRGGVIIENVNAAPRVFDFGSMQGESIPVTLPDIITLWHDHHTPSIATYVHISGTAFASANLAEMPDGPSEAERVNNRYHAAVEIRGSDGSSARGTLNTVNGYSFTPLAAVEAAKRILAGVVAPGFQTPAGLFGPRFAEAIADTTITIA